MTEEERKASVLEILAILYKIDLSEREADAICKLTKLRRLISSINNLI